MRVRTDKVPAWYDIDKTPDGLYQVYCKGSRIKPVFLFKSKSEAINAAVAHYNDGSLNIRAGFMGL